MGKPWDMQLTTAPVRIGSGCDVIGPSRRTGEVVSWSTNIPADVAELFAAAPAMARSLAMVERLEHDEGFEYCAGCGTTWGRVYDNATDTETKKVEHLAGCHLDAALTAAGLDADAREAVRKGANDCPR